ALSPRLREADGDGLLAALDGAALAAFAALERALLASAHGAFDVPAGALGIPGHVLFSSWHSANAADGGQFRAPRICTVIAVERSAAVSGEGKINVLIASRSP